MPNWREFSDIFISTLFEYETSKVVQIKSWKIGFIYRLIQLGIVMYVTLWVMYRDKGYQTFDYPVAGVTAKLKGVAFANLTRTGPLVWDVADFVVPPQQNSGFFVATNMIISRNQTLGRCPESIDVYGIKCSNKSQCKAGESVHIGSGIMTGDCIVSDRDNLTNVCEIYGWCPTEHDEMLIRNKPLLSSAPNFTVLLKNSIEFSKFNIKRRNILSWMNKEFLSSCRYDPMDDRNKFCPIFRLSDLIKYSKAKNQNIWVHGGLISIHIEWDCNLDLDVNYCVPKYTFRRLDDFDIDVAKGWNFRYSQHYVENGIKKRTLIKAYGIQCFITVSGKGGKFHPFTFSMNLGSGLALLGIASVLCDIFLLNIVRKRELYKRARTDTFRTALVKDDIITRSKSLFDNFKLETKNDTANGVMEVSTIKLEQTGSNCAKKSQSSDCVWEYLENEFEPFWNDFMKLSKSTELPWVDEESITSSQN